MRSVLLSFLSVPVDLLCESAQKGGRRNVGTYEVHNTELRSNIDVIYACAKQVPPAESCTRSKACTHKHV